MTDLDPLLRALRGARPLAIVGLSADPQRPSWRVARALQAQGLRIIPVNPKHAEILGEKCYADLRAIPEPVGLVDVFRRAAECPAVAREAVAIGAQTLWLQLGVVSEEAARIAAAAGLTVVMDRCLKIEYARVMGG